MDAYFLTNPEVKRFRKMAEGWENLTQEWKQLQKEVRDVSASLLKLQASTLPRSEHQVLRDRVARLEAATETCLPDLTDSMKKLLESTLTQQGRLDTLEVLSKHSNSSLDRLTEKQDNLNETVIELQTNGESIGRSFRELKSDLNVLKDSSGQTARFIFVLNYFLLSIEFINHFLSVD